MEITDKTVKLYETCIDFNSNKQLQQEDLTLILATGDTTQTDNLVIARLIHNPDEGLFVNFENKGYDFFFEIEYLTAEDNVLKNQFNSLEKLEQTMSDALMRAIGKKWEFTNVKATIIFNLLLSQESLNKYPKV